MPTGSERAAAESGADKDPCFDFFRTEAFPNLPANELALKEQAFKAQRIALLGHLGCNVAHEFKNFLCAMTMQIALIKENPLLPPEIAGQLQALEELAERASGVTAQLLMFSRGQPMDIQVLDLNEIIEGRSKLVSKLLGAGIELQLVSSSEPLWIEGNALLIEQVLMNLCINAKDAMPDGGKLRVEVLKESVWDRDEVRHLACLSVSDNGVGIDPEVKEHIFEPFFTTKPLGQGTGLGLATVHDIMTHHNGSVEVESQVGSGTTLRALFPLHTAPNATNPLRVAFAADGGKESILLVDDDPTLRPMMVTILTRAGYRVVDAVNTNDALAKWKASPKPLDMVLTDYFMPGGANGTQLINELLKDNPSLHIVLMTGYSNPICEPMVSWPKHAVFLQKPFQMRTLLETVRQSFSRDAVDDAI